MSLSRRHFLCQGALSSAAWSLSGSTFGRGLLGQAAGVDARINVLPGEPIGTIAPEVYGHFIEQLGGVIYDGVWVGEKSKIPNQGGVRTAFLDTMRSIKAPVLRWPGGCFADSYDWRDGLGARDKRPQRSGFWGNEESNRYGLHEFMQTCRAIGCEPYLAADLRSLPARDFYQWVEYCNAPVTRGADGGVNALAAERARNGSPEPFRVRYWGVGNETWGCGGEQTPEEYGGEYRRFTEWLPSYPPADGGQAEPLRLIACGANGDDTRWANGVMRSIGDHHRPWGLSTHYYTSGDAKNFAAGDALEFDAATYYDMMARGAFMENVILDSWGAMTDSEHGRPARARTRIVMDEWGAWYGASTRLGKSYNLSQQSTMRDAILSGITLDIFHRHAEKMAMANVAQTINCLHSLMLAEGDQFTVTPVYHVFRMYMAHMGAQSVRAEFAAASIANTAAQVSPVGGNSAVGSIDAATQLAGLSGSASVKGKVLTLTVVNPHLDQPVTAEITVGAGATLAGVTGQVLTGPDIHAHNDFQHRDAVKAVAAQVGAPAGGRLVHTFPAASLTALTMTLA